VLTHIAATESVLLCVPMYLPACPAHALISQRESAERIFTSRRSFSNSLSFYVTYVLAGFTVRSRVLDVRQ
jgi:hypothetical protein